MDTDRPPPSRAELLGMGLIAMATLLFEVNLTRIFSVTLWYYFGVLSISLAMLGTATAGVFCYLFPDRFIGDSYRKLLGAFAGLFALLAPVSVYVHLHLDFSDYQLYHLMFYVALGINLLFLFLTFFCAGMCITILLFRHARSLGTIYGFDLAGAAIGCVLVIALLLFFSGPAITFGVSGIALASAALFQTSRRGRAGFAAAAVAGLAALAINDAAGVLRVRNVKSYTRHGVQSPEPKLVFEKWGPVSRVAVQPPTISPKVGEYMLITNDAGAPTRMFRFDGDISKRNHFEHDYRTLAHKLRPGGEVLIIGSGGGFDVLGALYHGQSRITAVEINPLIGRVVRDEFADFTGRLFHHPKVTLHINEGRNFVAGSDEKYDVIIISMIDSWVGSAAGAFVFNENALYTREAIRDYMEHLKPDGILSITRYYGFEEALRLTNLAVHHLAGSPSLARRIMVTSQMGPLGNSTVMMRNGTFSDADVAAVLESSRKQEFHVIHAPGLADSQMARDPNTETFRRIIRAAAEGRSWRDIEKSSHRDITPPTDDRPFFFFTHRLSTMFEFDAKEHAARKLAVPLLYGMLLGFFVLSLLAVLLPMALSRRLGIRNVPGRFPTLLYFVGLGVGFMLVEICLIQRLTVFLGQPAYSFVVALATMLAAGGAGSLCSTRLDPRRLTLILGGVLGILLLYLLLVYDLFIDLMWLGMPLRILLSMLVVAVPGFLMGMAFPMGVQILQRRDERLIPWGWAVNAAFSVFASILALILALNLGLKVVLFFGALCYLMSLLVVRFSWSRPPASR